MERVPLINIVLSQADQLAPLARPSLQRLLLLMREQAYQKNQPKRSCLI